MSALIERLRAEGEKRYHDRHRYHVLMHEGRLTREQLQQWVLNRYYYQTRIPIKDALILAKSDDPAFRRMWIHRLRDHDGEREGEGGLAQREQTEAVIEVAVGKDDSGDRRVPRSARMQLRETLDLRADLRRRVEQHPALAIDAHRDALLRAGRDVAAARARLATVRAAAVPLGKSAAGGRTEHPDLHGNAAR